METHAVFTVQSKASSRETQKRRRGLKLASSATFRGLPVKSEKNSTNRLGKNLLLH
jgi:hypothetical protein